MTSSPPVMDGDSNQDLRRKEAIRLRFTLHSVQWPGRSTCCHRPSGGDVYGRIHVSVPGVPAGAAAEDGLALARLPIHDPACRTRLGRVRSSNLLDPTRSLVLQSGDQQAPTIDEDAAVESCLRCNVGSGLIEGSSSRAGHGLDIEVLDPDYIELPGETSARLLDPVLATVDLSDLDPRDPTLQFLTAVRSALGSSQAALQTQQALGLLRAQARGSEQLSRGKRRGHCHPAIDADDGPCGRSRNRGRRSSEGDVPAARSILIDSVGGCGGDRARETEAHPANLRHQHLSPPVAEQFDPASRRPDNAEALVHSALSERRSTMRSCIEGRQGVLEVPERLLLHRLRPSTQPLGRGPRLGQLPRLSHVARGCSSATAPVGVLLHRKIPHVASVSAVAQKPDLLGAGWKQPVPTHSTHSTIQHRQSLEGRQWRVSPALTDGVPTP